MSSHPVYTHPAPGWQPAPAFHPALGYHHALGYPSPQQTAQPYISPVYPIVTQPAPLHPLSVHPAQRVPYPQYWPARGEHLPLPRHTTRRRRSEHEAFEDYDYLRSQSKPKDHPRTHGQHRTRPEQPLHPKKAIEYQDQNQEAHEYAFYSDDATAIFTGPDSPRNTPDKNHKVTKKPTRSPQVHTEDDSSKWGRTHEWVESLPDGADKEAKEGLADPAGTRRKPTTKKSKSTQRVHTNDDSSNLGHAKKYIESQPESADKQAKGSSVNPVGTERKHTTKKSMSSQRVQTKGDSSDQGHTHEYLESRPDGADKQAKGSLVNSAGNERKHTTRKPTSVPHPKTDSKRRPEKPGEEDKERTSTNTTDTRRAHTIAHSSSRRSSTRPRESQSRVKITTDDREGSLNLEYDPKRGKSGTSTPVEKSTGHHSKEKAKGSPRVSQSKKLTKKEVPNYYATDCSMDDDVEAISRQIKKKKGKIYPERRVKRDASEQRLAEMNEESGEANAAADVPWHMAYRKGKDGKTVPR